jgi:hypothetical protein
MPVLAEEVRGVIDEARQLIGSQREITSDKEDESWKEFREYFNNVLTGSGQTMYGSAFTIKADH